MNPTLKQLRYFEALARHGHFGRAAASCAISQPALSMQVKELEEGFGFPLFERRARQVALTRLGEEFAPRVRAILRSVDELGELARSTQETLAGPMRIGIIPTIAPYMLPRVIAELGKQYADLDLQIRETLTQRLIEELLDGRLDTAIVALPVSEPSLSEIALFEEDFVLVRPEADESKAVPNAASLAKMKLLLLEEGHCFRDQALSFCNVASARPRDGLDGSSLSTLVQMVSAGMGVTLIPDMAVGVETRGTPVSVCRFNDPKPSRTIGMIWRKASPLAKQFTQLAETVRKVATG